MMEEINERFESTDPILDYSRMKDKVEVPIQLRFDKIFFNPRTDPVDTDKRLGQLNRFWEAVKRYNVTKSEILAGGKQTSSMFRHGPHVMTEHRGLVARTEFMRVISAGVKSISEYREGVDKDRAKARAEAEYKARKARAEAKAKD